jgi:hypothetical protein
MEKEILLTDEQKMIDEGYIDGKKSFDYLSKEINKSFNWEKVHKAMIAVNWNWCLGKDSFGQDNMGVPSLVTIKNHAYALLKDAYEKGNTISTGGFSAGWDCGELYLVFTLEEATA